MSSYEQDCASIVGGDLTADQAAKVKWWTTGLLRKIVDRCVPLRGGYVNECRLARDFVDT